MAYDGFISYSHASCNYVGHMPAAKDYGRMGLYHLLRRRSVDRARGTVRR
jgi:hypothetical protein